MKNFIHVISHLIFWVWNLTFIGLIYIWLLPQTGFALFHATRDGTIDPTFTASLLALLLIPPICTMLGLVRLRKYPVLLMRLFYGVEAPLFAMCLLRMFLIRELTLASGFVLGMVVLAIATFAIELLSGYSAYRPRLALAQMISHSLILLVGLYGGALLLLYSIPSGAVLIGGFFQSLWHIGSIWQLVINPIGILFGFLAVSSILVFITMPYVLVNFYLRAWNRIFTAFAKQYSQPKARGITGATIALCVAIFVGLQAQPQVKAFSLLHVPSSDSSASATAQAPKQLTLEELKRDRQTQLQNATTIKTGLTNAYLHNYRYLSPWAKSNALANFYRTTFNFSATPSSATEHPFLNGLQTIHNALLSPFLYQGDAGDAAKAAKLYAQVFDEPIQKGERESIRKALQATANREETSAGVLNLDQEIVYLASQKVNVTEQGDWATIEIQEKYSNPTRDAQEIFYSFSLPESATITGLWLGDAASPKRFPFVVSPRGAAQAVYKNEVALGQVRKPVDPALLEQVGPRQYRLRVFPIPAATPVVRNRSVATEGNAKPGPGELYLSMSYQVLQESGGWPLPHLTEKRSIYWNAKTEHLRGQNSIALPADQWFEAALPTKQVKATAHRVELAEGYRVTAVPLRATEKKLPTNKRLAVVVDSSYSMREHTKALKEAIQQLKGAGNNEVDFYNAMAQPSQEIAIPIASQILTPMPELDVAKVQFYGSLQPTDLLQQFAQAQTNQSTKQPYDGVILLTDRGSYELANDTAKLPTLSAPLWIVHIDGKLASAYPDILLQLLKTSQGGVETNVTKVLQQIALASSKTVALDGYSWKIESLPKQDSQKQDSQKLETVSKVSKSGANQDAFEAIAARQLIAQQSRTPNVSEALDKLHAIAKRTGIVTPYSSMIVLVDERQREELKKAEASKDRFKREVEKGEDDLTEPNNPLSTSIPDPSQVLGLMLVAITFVFLKRKPARIQRKVNGDY
jgi:putative PEP-CTERM system integral membrane protein